MELWIRSQNRKVLAEIHSISIEEKTSTKFSIVGNDEWRLGIYETEERALEVLDEIQRILQPRIIATIKASEDMKELIGSMSAGKILKQDMDFKELSTYVYEMPKE